MKNFTYTGKQVHTSTIQVKDDKGKIINKDIFLAKGDTASLDETHPYIKSLVASGLLVETTEQNSKQKKS